MNILVTLGHGIAKNRIKQPFPAVEKGIYRQPLRKADPLSQAQTKKTKGNRAAAGGSEPYSDEQLKLVSKGSFFERRAVQDFLGPHHNHRFARHNVEAAYDVSRAKANYVALKQLKNADDSTALLFNKSQRYVEEMIPLLVRLTPPEVSAGHSKRIFRNEQFTEIPPIPNFATQQHLLGNYVSILSHTTFYYKRSSSLNGVIPKILRNIMHPSNIKTAHLRNTEVFNDVIFFFSQRSDYASCRELFSQMKLEGIAPNTKTFNLLLRNVLKNSHIRKLNHPIQDAVYYLKQMQYHEVQADSVTWVTCYNLLLEDLSRDVFLEKLIECKVPITPQLILSVLTSSYQNSSQILRFLSSSLVPLDTKLFNFCLKRLLQEEKFDVAWAFIDHAQTNAKFKINHESLNIFLRVFAEVGRLDLALLTFNSITRRYNVSANLHSFDMLLKALVRNGYTKNFPIILKYLQRIRAEYTEGVQVYSYWLSKAQAVAKFNIAPSPGIKNFEKAKQLLESITWDTQGMRWECWQSCGPSVRKVFRFMGCVPNAVKAQGKRQNFFTDKKVVLKKAEYKNRIRALAVHSAMAKRVPYAEDRYSALKEELHGRNILR
ncbi:LADA_0A06964g1_1 [Lachancea dasiensis]|uniref:Mitochondrial 15S rRNA processing factor CCM1 n=1 Tax=Lachancea dasiensis TaxID=1072105 RepID=A0A1G4IPN9_9SACH|nr:LADA_0A06964g1_1 [Lachancea dasiensis]